MEENLMRPAEETYEPPSSSQLSSDEENCIKRKSKKKDNKEKHQCPYKDCYATFPRPWRLKNHLKVHEGEKIYKCTEEGCLKAYTSKSHLDRHYTQSHKAPTSEQLRYMSSSSESLVPSTKCCFNGCGKVLKTRDTLIKHFKRFHTERKFECSICNMKFIEEEQLLAHSIRRHKGLKSHRCEKCNIVFPKLHKYNRHMRGHRMHVCPIITCKFITDNYLILRRHIASEHPKTFTCEVCGKNVKNKCSIRKHIEAHLVQEGLLEPANSDSSNNNHPCSLCPLSFTTKASLLRHIKNIHETPAELKVCKYKTERAFRKDKHLPKKSVASRLASVNIPLDIEKSILNKDKYSADDLTTQKVYNLMVLDLIKRGSFVKDDKCDT